MCHWCSCQNIKKSKKMIWTKQNKNVWIYLAFLEGSIFLNDVLKSYVANTKISSKNGYFWQNKNIALNIWNVKKV